jgi:hypothetical protein
MGASLICASAGIVREKSKRGRVGSAHPGTRTEGFRRNMPQSHSPVGSQVRRTGWGEQIPKEDQNVRSRLRAGIKQAREQMMLAGEKGVHSADSLPCEAIVQVFREKRTHLSTDPSRRQEFVV